MIRLCKVYSSLFGKGDWMLKVGRCYLHLAPTFYMTLEYAHQLFYATLCFASQISATLLDHMHLLPILARIPPAECNST